MKFAISIILSSKITPLKKIIQVIILLFLSLSSFSQYWQQEVNYTIDVSLNDKENTLDAFEKIIYTNNSPDTLRYIWFHLWPNAYKNDQTAFSDQLLENGNTNFYFSSKEEKGYINRLDFKVNGITSLTQDHPQFIDIVKLILPHSLPPHQKVIITTPFHVKLPFNFSRGGYDGQAFQLTQWYPKPAVYDSRGWHPMPYLDQGEFFSEFGNFDVTITTPGNYVVAATGKLQDTAEQQWLKTRTYDIWGKEYIKKFSTVKKISSNNNASLKQQHYALKITDSLPSAFPPSNSENKTIHFTQDSVHDFAWFADKRFVVDRDTCKLPSGKIISIATYYTIREHEYWKNSLQYAKDAIRFYSAQVGEYPYQTVSVVQGPQSFGGGMEYPSITIIAPLASERDLDETIAHELGHNWFYGALASNERDHPWMDEGINTFYEYAYVEGKYGKQTQEKELLFQTKAKLKTDQPIETVATHFSTTNYDLVAYHKTAQWLQYIQGLLGKEQFARMMNEYFVQWHFKHPYPQDFKDIVQHYAGKQADAIFHLLNTTGVLPDHHLSGFKFITPFKIQTINNYLQSPTRNALLIAPAIGANNYDKLMAGLFISNYKLPPANFRFFTAPLYSTGSKKLSGIARFNYTIPSDKLIRRTDFFLNTSTFSMDKFTDSAQHSIYLRFQKLVPGIRITFKKPDARSTINKYIQWKTFLIREQSLQFRRDTSFSGVDTSVLSNFSSSWQKRYLNQLQFVYENYRALYPFKVNVQLEQAQDFIKTGLTINYYFNYPGGGGMQARLFAGKFLYLNGKTLEKEFANDRYFLNMTGPKGYEDYTYSEYFVGRNSFQGIASQQIMIRDGAFKVRTDLLAAKIGKTDNWLTAINLNSSLPDKINPLFLLPIRIPVHVFLDAGTYAEAWQSNFEGDKILYDLGIHVPILAETINVYIPLFYNKVYGDYFKSTLSPNRFLKTISFSINLYNKSLKQINHEIEF